MNYKEYLYCKLAEEAGEVAQAAMKANIFGEDGVSPVDNLKKSNLQNLVNEINDMLAVIDLLGHEIPGMAEQRIAPNYFANKQETIKTYWNIIKEKK